MGQPALPPEPTASHQDLPEPESAPANPPAAPIGTPPEALGTSDEQTVAPLVLNPSHLVVSDRKWTNPLEVERPLIATAVPIDRWYWLEWLAVFSLFALYAASPAPERNEPHYLCKARHFWDPSFASPDFFLNSADAHFGFYITIGWLSAWMPLPAFAWTGRIAYWLLLAAGWVHLSRSILPSRGTAVLAATLFVFLQDRYTIAGEWILDGLEAKGFAWAGVFFGLSAVLRRQWPAALLWLGFASALHVLVGGWATLAALLFGFWQDRLWQRWRPLWPWLLLAALIAAWGLVPALLLFGQSKSSAAIASTARQIYVYERLPHHLYPPGFVDWRVRWGGLVLGIWALTLPLAWRIPSLRPIQRLTLLALGFAAVGCLLALLAQFQRDLAAALLRFYWFRLADEMVVISLSFTAASFAYWLSRRVLWLAWGWILALLVLAGMHIGPTVWWHWNRPTPAAFVLPGLKELPLDEQRRRYQSWQQLAQWVRNETDPEAVFIGPQTAPALLWDFHRAEVANWKNMPQDDAGIVAWQQRMIDLYGSTGRAAPHPSVATRGEQAVVDLAIEYAADYLLCQRQDPKLNLPIAYQNEHFAVYQFRDLMPGQRLRRGRFRREQTKPLAHSQNSSSQDWLVD